MIIYKKNTHSFNCFQENIQTLLMIKNKILDINIIFKTYLKIN